MLLSCELKKLTICTYISDMIPTSVENKLELINYITDCVNKYILYDIIFKRINCVWNC